MLGRVVATVHLPENKFYYGYNSWGLSRTATPHNAAGLVHDALVSCAADVPWSEFDLDGDGFVDMLWVVHQGIAGETSPDRYSNDLWSITSRLSGYWSSSSAFETPVLMPGSLTQHVRVDRFSMLPELSSLVPGQRAEIGVFCHEFGHALGLPDLFDTRDAGARNAGPGNWSLMGTGGYGGDGFSPQYPTHPGAWPSLYLGWTQSLQPTSDASLVLPWVSSGPNVLELSFQGESTPEHFLVEARKREGFDRNLPGEGLVVYHVDEAVIGQSIQSNTVNSGLTPGLVLVEADGASDLTQGVNRGDARDVFPGATGRTSIHDGTPPPNTHTFLGAPTNVGLFDIAPTPGGMSFFAQVRAPGWQPPADRTVGEYLPADARTPANTTALAPDGTCYSVASESRSGRLQVVLRTRRAGTWDEGVEISQSQGDAFEPALALLGADGLAVAWSDTRQGTARLYYRALVKGTWTPERLLSTLPGDSRAPSIAADDKGGVHVAWVLVGQGAPRVEYLRFPYLSPSGQPFTLSGTSAVAASPFVAAIPDGGAIVIWTDNATWPPALWFSRCGLDSLPGSPKTFTRQSGLYQNGVSALVQPDGSIHAVWIENGSSTSELHYQFRRAIGFAPQDTTLETSSSTLASARLARDPGGGLHVVFERSISGITQIRYRRRHPSLGWDAGSTDVSALEDGSSIQPGVLAYSPGNVIVTYRGLEGMSARFMERCRLTDQHEALAVPRDSTLAALPQLFLLPNPVRAGQDVELRWSAATGAVSDGAGPGALEVFDLAGRRVAAVGLTAEGPSLRGRLGADLTRPWLAGVYFVRPRGALGPAQRLVVLR